MALPGVVTGVVVLALPTYYALYGPNSYQGAVWGGSLSTASVAGFFLALRTVVAPTSILVPTADVPQPRIAGSERGALVASTKPRAIGGHRIAPRRQLARPRVALLVFGMALDWPYRTFGQFGE